MSGKLNCRPGDLAVLVRCALGQQGLVLRCIRLVKDGETLNGVTIETRPSPRIWVVDRNMRVLDGSSGVVHVVPVCMDENLRPIRDQPGDDETLTWVGLPKPLAHQDGELDAPREPGGVPA